MQNENDAQNRNDILSTPSSNPNDIGKELNKTGERPVNHTVNELPNPIAVDETIKTAEVPQGSTPPLETFTPNSEPVKKKFPIGIVAVVVLIIGLALGAYFSFSSSMMTPKSVFTTAIENLYSVAKTVYDPDKEANLASVLFSESGLSSNLDGKLNIEVDGEKLSYGFKTKIETDKDLKTNILNLGLTDSNGLILDINAYQKDDKTYLESSRLFDKIIDLGEALKDVTETAPVEELSEDDIYSLLTITKDYLIKNMEEKDFKNGTGTLDINGKSYTVDKYSYIMTNEVMEKLFTGYADEIENKVNSSSLTLSEETYDSILSLKDVDYYDLETITIDIYMNKKETYGFAITEGDLELMSFSYDGNLLYANIKDDEDDEEIRIKGKTIDGKLTLDVDSVMSSKETKYATFIIEELTLKENDEKIKINYSLDTEETPISGLITLSGKTKIHDKDVETDYDIEFKMATSAFEIGLEFNIDAKTIDEVAIPDVSNSVKIEDLTESDYETILDNFNKSLEGTDYEFLLDLISMFYGTGSDPDYGYDYDYNWDDEYYDDYDYGL